MADAERAEDYGSDVSLDWLVAVVVVEEEAQRSVLRKRNRKSVKKRRELAAAVQVEEQVDYLWHCLRRLWLGDYSMRNRIAWSQKHFEGCLVQRRVAVVDLELEILRKEVREVREVRVPVERTWVVSLYRQMSKVAWLSRGNPFEVVWGRLTTLWKLVGQLDRVSSCCQG